MLVAQSGPRLSPQFRSLQLIPAANGFDGTSAMKDKAHLPHIQQETGLPYSEMLFFDDEHKNVQRVRPQPQCRTGVSMVPLELPMPSQAGITPSAAHFLPCRCRAWAWCPPWLTQPAACACSRWSAGCNSFVKQSSVRRLHL